MRQSYQLIIILFVLAACDESRVYEKNVEIDSKLWIADSTAEFQFNVPKLSESYNIYFNVRNSVAYPYENIYVTYVLSDTLNNELKKELVNYNLFDPKTGEPFGSGLGDVFDHQFMLLENYKFERSGPYNFKLQQYMRMDSLPEVLSVGIRVEKVELPN